MTTYLIYLLVHDIEIEEMQLWISQVYQDQTIMCDIQVLLLTAEYEKKNCDLNIHVFIYIVLRKFHFASLDL